MTSQNEKHKRQNSIDWAEKFLLNPMSLLDIADHGSPHIPLLYYMRISMTTWKKSGLQSFHTLTKVKQHQAWDKVQG